MVLMAQKILSSVEDLIHTPAVAQYVGTLGRLGYNNSLLEVNLVEFTVITLVFRE